MSIDEPRFAGCASMARSFPDRREQKILPMVDSAVGFLTFLSCSASSQGELIGSLFTRRTEVRPFTPAQIKLLKPLPTRGDRHRERAAVPRA